MLHLSKVCRKILSSSPSTASTCLSCPRSSVYEHLHFAGPFYFKVPGGALSKVLFTCCVTRAVLLDLIPDMSWPTFIRSFPGVVCLPLFYQTMVRRLKLRPRCVVSSPEVQRYFDEVVLPRAPGDSSRRHCRGLLRWPAPYFLEAPTNWTGVYW